MSGERNRHEAYSDGYLLVYYTYVESGNFKLRYVTAEKPE